MLENLIIFFLALMGKFQFLSSLPTTRYWWGTIISCFYFFFFPLKHILLVLTGINSNEYPRGLAKEAYWVTTCVEVLRPNQSNGVILSMINLPNHTFNGQAQSSKRLISTVHSLLPETDNRPS